MCIPKFEIFIFPTDKLKETAALSHKSAASLDFFMETQRMMSIHCYVFLFHWHQTL